MSNENRRIFIILGVFFLGFLGGVFVYFLSTRTIPTPESSFKVVKHSCIYSFNGKTKNPNWVVQRLNQKQDKIVASSIPLNEDQEIPSEMRPILEDYKNTSFLPGQISLFNKSLEENFLTKCCPMKPKVFETWKKIHLNVLERFKKSRQEDCLLFSGPLFMDTKENTFKYKTIGQNQVAVPTHFFMIIFNSIKTNDYSAWIFPNDETIMNDHSLDFFSVKKETIEKEGGFAFPKHLGIYSYPSSPPKM